LQRNSWGGARETLPAIAAEAKQPAAKRSTAATGD
jgi:hypothetical protein